MAKKNIIPDAYIVSEVMDLLVEENFREFLNAIPCSFVPTIINIVIVLSSKKKYSIYIIKIF
ncbi:hypothetical protein ACOSQ4_004068 [Xanthoceras sorbifolium]